MARLEDWTLFTRFDDKGKAQMYLTGKVYGHPRADLENNTLVDGHVVVTSNVVNIDYDMRLATTRSGTVYELGRKFEK